RTMLRTGARPWAPRTNASGRRDWLIRSIVAPAFAHAVAPGLVGVPALHRNIELTSAIAVLLRQRRLLDPAIGTNGQSLQVVQGPTLLMSYRGARRLPESRRKDRQTT